MDDFSMMDQGLQFEVLASSLRADLQDARSFLTALAEKLGKALPGQCTVERKGGLFSKEKPVQRIVLEIGEYRYMIEYTGHGLHATRARAVRGIVLKTEEISVNDWIDALSRDLTAHAATSADARMAMERLLT